MSFYVFGLLLLVAIIVFGMTCQTSMEAFEDMDMRPWFGYEPGRYGPGWGRKGCVAVPPSSCVMV
jgi:hypothetical protein